MTPCGCRKANKKQPLPPHQRPKADGLFSGRFVLPGSAFVVWKAHGFGRVVHDQKKPNGKGERHCTGEEKGPLPAGELHHKAQPCPRNKIASQGGGGNKHRRNIALGRRIPDGRRTNDRLPQRGKKHAVYQPHQQNDGAVWEKADQQIAKQRSRQAQQHKFFNRNPVAQHPVNQMANAAADKKHAADHTGFRRRPMQLRRHFRQCNGKLGAAKIRKRIRNPAQG